ncbi:MAG TPA: FumA C-terminus/TtdB family hydratase beta subunit [bacterium]|nr:FumA C-terminus/TtdB family hydratase beta subunit [bacterium]HPP09157.1 FumA C-terminus/TtdB family hydratase beta subunit [bacterium]
MKKIIAPVDSKIIEELKAGDFVEISGIIYGARDAAHRRFAEILKKKEKLPFDPEGNIIYYVGPTPAPPGHIIGSCGPTTSTRMDKFTPVLLEAGLKGMIGKGIRSSKVKQAIVKYGAVYFVTYGGCGAYLSQFIKSCKVVAFFELGPEAVYQMAVEDFPVIVGIDSSGRDIYIS